MRQLTWKTVMLGLFLAISPQLNAAEPGIVRLSDSDPGTSSHNSRLKMHVPAWSSGRIAKSKSGKHGGYYKVDSAPDAYTGKRAPSPTYVWIAGDGSNSYSPDYGWRRPLKVPYEASYWAYNRYYPNQPYGSPGLKYAPTYPMVYMPTDTTQLGYYNQHVPTWQPAAQPLPTPWPEQWHRREGIHGHYAGYGATGYSAPLVGTGTGLNPTPAMSTDPSVPGTISPLPARPLTPVAPRVPTEVPSDLPAEQTNPLPSDLPVGNALPTAPPAAPEA